MTDAEHDATSPDSPSQADSIRGTGGLSGFFGADGWSIPAALGAFAGLAVLSGLVTLTGVPILTIILVLVGSATIAAKSHSPGRSTLYGIAFFFFITLAMAFMFADVTASYEAEFGLLLLPPVGSVLGIIGALCGSALFGNARSSFDATEEELTR